ncbi:MAG: bifunctional folylpolyglutamate synthase/dihydrofolate synthase [Planctomycetes bacterium]|nr:bifunctional folylpolyglutamate synthase/dihydrofolate synthase [Planctomycetota bacterium]
MPGEPNSPVTDDASAQAFLDSLANIEKIAPRRVDPSRAFNLARMERLAAELGNPQHAWRCVHVAGSKGKGSVCDMLAAALRGAGLCVGLYSSPHLVHERERISVSGRMISASELVDAVRPVADAASRVPESLGAVSRFEALTAAAFTHFRESAVDVAVVEVGMGGTFDATNVVRPTVCAIAAIHTEHAELLGGTLESIAAHKAGIMKPGVPCITIPQDDRVTEVLRARAAEVGCPLLIVGQDIPFHVHHEPHARILVTIRVGDTGLDHVAVPLPGEHQALNAALALACVIKLQRLGVPLRLDKIKEGLTLTPRRGRLELVRESPRVVIDGAHTPESVRALLHTLRTAFDFDTLIAVFGCASDKNASAMLIDLAASADKIVLTRAKGPRAADPKDLKAILKKDTGKSAQVVPDCAEAVQVGVQAASGRSLVLVCGSFAVAGEVKAALQP